MTESSKLVEYRIETLKHVIALKDAIRLRQEGFEEAAWARIEGAVTSLLTVAEGQIAGIETRCQHCGESSPMIQWVRDDFCCPECGRAEFDE